MHILPAVVVAGRGVEYLPKSFRGNKNEKPFMTKKQLTDQSL